MDRRAQKHLQAATGYVFLMLPNRSALKRERK